MVCLRLGLPDWTPKNSTKKFYRELFAWFEWAVEQATFPTDEKLTLGPEEHIIRLITRLLFVWFIKEKGLISDELFSETQVRDLLKDYDRGLWGFLLPCRVTKPVFRHTEHGDRET